jgi:HlyD family secretion protein
MNMAIADTRGQDRVVDAGHLRSRRFWLVSAAIIFVIFAGWGAARLVSAFGAGAVLDRNQLRIAEVKMGDLLREVIAQGRVVVANSPTLFSPEGGIVELYVKPGDHVHKEQLLAVVASPELGEQLAREKSALTRLQMDAERQKIESQQRFLQEQQALALAQVRLKAMQREKRRAEQSFAKQIMSELDYEKVLDDLERAQVEFAHASENLALLKSSLNFYDRSLASQTEGQMLIIRALERRLEALKIRSPVAGMVGNLAVDHRQAVAANQALISVVDLTTYEVEASIPESMTAELSPGMSAEIQTADARYAGTLTAISPEVIGGSVRGRIRFNGESPPQLRQNQRLTTRIHLEKKSGVLLVDRGPFFDDFRGHVYTIQGSRAHRVDVSLGSKSLQHVEVLHGLAEDDLIIVSAMDTRNPGASFIISD